MIRMINIKRAYRIQYKLFQQEVGLLRLCQLPSAKELKNLFERTTSLQLTSSVLLLCKRKENYGLGVL